jgi:starch synthase (maltosyl-transferring)
MIEETRLMPSEGRRRVVIENVRPQVDGGRFPVKHIAGDVVTVTATIYGDGHDHIAARVLYRRVDEKKWQYISMKAVGNDRWEGRFVTDAIGLWQFYVQGWIDHFATWSHDLMKRVEAQDKSDVSGKTLDLGGKRQNSMAAVPEASRDIPLALLTGATLLYNASIEATGDDAERLKHFATSLQHLSELDAKYYDNPISDELKELAERYPDLRFAERSDNFNIRVDRERARFSTWYEFFPRSAGENGKPGTLSDAARLIPDLATMGFDVIYFPPIHPIGSSYRKGKNNSAIAEEDDVGSPWAIGSQYGGHTAIAPELGDFSDFDSMIGVAQECGVEIALDIAFQCSPDHPWVKTHPDWFSIRPDGSIQYAENPPKKYQDIYPLNFESNDWRGLWEELCNVFIFWIKRGVKIFRVDNPHTKALPFWEWCIQKIQHAYPDVIFLAEAFTRPHVMYGLAKRGFSQSYTYFSWRNSKTELTEYFKEISSEPVRSFFRPNLWPNTPDILPDLLQKGGRAAFVQRAVLAATLGANYGVYGPAFELMEHRPIREGSEEYADSEKYQLKLWNRNREDSLMPLLRTLNEVRHAHFCLQQNDTLHFHDIDNPQLLCYSKRIGPDTIIVVVNLDTANVQSGWTNLDLAVLDLSLHENYVCRDLLSAENYVWTGTRNYVLLNPTRVAHVLHVQCAEKREGGAPRE